MPRPENPLDPESGPIAAFAVALRELRTSAGAPSYRAMAKRSFFGFTTLAEAAAGRRLPSWEITRAYVAACDGDVHAWERRWTEAASLLRRTGDTGSEAGGERSPPAPGRPGGTVPEQARRSPPASGPPGPVAAGDAARPMPSPPRGEPVATAETARAEDRPWTSFQSRGGPTVRRILLGAQLRRLRERRGISTEDAGYEIRASHSKISRMELGRVGFKERDVADLLTLYGVVDAAERAPLLALAREAGLPGRWHRFGDVLPPWFEIYLGLEEAASIVRAYEPQLVPELMQSEDYARAVVRLGNPNAPAEDVERRVRLRTRRQERLSEPGAPMLWAIVDETALRRPVGGRETVHGQLVRLVRMADLPNVTLQIVPFARGAAVPVSNAFTILRFSEADLPDVVYLEQLTSGMYLDKEGDVDAYLAMMNTLSTAALSPAESLRFLHALLQRT